MSLKYLSSLIFASWFLCVTILHPNQALVPFISDCAYVSSFPVQFFLKLLCYVVIGLQLCLVLSVSVKRLVEKAQCFVLVERLAGKIVFKMTSGALNHADKPTIFFFQA